MSLVKRDLPHFVVIFVTKT